MTVSPHNKFCIWGSFLYKSFQIKLKSICHIVSFLFLVKDDALNKLNNYNRLHTHPVKIHTIQIILKSIVNVHRRTIKGNKFQFLNSTQSSKQICTPVGLAITMVKLDPLEVRCQVPTVIQYWRDNVIYISIAPKDIHHGLSIQFNNKGINV